MHHEKLAHTPGMINKNDVQCMHASTHVQFTLSPSIFLFPLSSLIWHHLSFVSFCMLHKGVIWHLAFLLRGWEGYLFQDAAAAYNLRTFLFISPALFQIQAQRRTLGYRKKLGAFSNFLHRLSKH